MSGARQLFMDRLSHVIHLALHMPTREYAYGNDFNRTASVGLYGGMINLLNKQLIVLAIIVTVASYYIAIC